MSLFDNDFIIRSQQEWEALLDSLLEELSGHLGIPLEKCSYFIEKQSEGEKSFGCHVDFRAIISKPLKLEVCGILCYSVNWNKRVSIGAYLLHYQNNERLSPQADDEKVHYIRRSIETWEEPQVEIGEGGEWSSYETTCRWDK